MCLDSSFVSKSSAHLMKILRQARIVRTISWVSPVRSDPELTAGENGFGARVVRN